MRNGYLALWAALATSTAGQAQPPPEPRFDARLLGSTKDGAPAAVGLGFRFDPRTAGWAPFGSLAGTVGREGPGSEAMIRAGASTGGAGGAVTFGGLGLASSLARAAAGVFAGGRFRIGAFEVLGEVGSMARFRGGIGAGPLSAGSLLALDSTTEAPIRRLTHGWVAAGWRRGPLDLSARMIRRSHLSASDRGGWEAAIGVAPVPGVRIQFAGGVAPIGASIYLPFRRHLSLTVGVGGPRRRAPAPPADPAAAAAAGGFVAIPNDSGWVTVRAVVPGASRVDLLGDVTGWVALPLRPAGPGRFEAALAAAPGIHLVNLLIDGGPPVIPPGLTPTDDGFGGRAGILVIAAPAPHGR